jgi:hypothetical protein
MSDMTPQEQLMLELINRARMDPTGEAKRFGISLNEGVANGDKISKAAKEVLAGNDDLITAARDHSEWMNDNDQFSHDEGNKDPGDRMTDAGYVFSGNWTWGENIAARFESRNINDALATELIVQSHADLFIDKNYPGRGHRTNILSEDFQEIGVGQHVGQFRMDGTNWNSSMVTQDFARSGDKVFITGVVYDDTVMNDDFFSVGEEVAGLGINGGGVADTTGSGGGYELQYGSGGGKTVAFGGGVTVDLTLGAENIKLDLVNGTEVWSNATITDVSSSVTELHLLGKGKASLHSADSGQAMYGNAASNTFEGNGGADDFVFSKGTTGKSEKKADIITDFSQADNDTIDLGSWDANSKQNGNQDFDFIGGEKFHGGAGELRFLQDGGDTWIEADTNGDRKADLLIRLEGTVTLVAGDFDL